MKIFFKTLFFLLPITLLACSGSSVPKKHRVKPSTLNASILPGANDISSYLSLIEGKKVGLLINQTSRIGNTHLLDTLLQLGINVKAIYTPEHGFRGKADAGEKVNSKMDQKTGIPIISLYGKHRKPSSKDLKGIDVLVFDLQDVGVRFYTYISSLHYMMEACAQQDIPVIVLDRPNPNGFYVAGPVMTTDFKSFIGMHPVPIVYGLTIGEYAQMINGEKWLKDDIQCELTIVKCQNYNHKMSYQLPIKPSPNLPNQRSILLYPSLCLFEGTVVSIGRGTNKQFQIIGHPKASDALGQFSFTPSPHPGAKNPKLKGELCHGKDLTTYDIEQLIAQPLDLFDHLVLWYKDLQMGNDFFRKKVKPTKKNPNPRYFFDKLVGTDQIRLMIEHGKTASELKNSWQKDLKIFKTKRKKYLLYEDFAK